MRLIEKSCPNCGADLEFDENAKSCKCNYCKRSFEIERDMNDIDKFNLVYDKIQKPVKAFFFIPFIFVGVIIIIITLTIIFGSINTSKKINEEYENPIKDIEELVNEKNQLVKDVSELDNDALEDIDNKCFTILRQKVVEEGNDNRSYQINGDPRLQKIVVAYKEDANSIISIYEVKYHNFFRTSSDQHTVYVPVVFTQVKNNFPFSLSNGKNPAPEYYFNDEHTYYIYAYSSYDEAYNGVVKPLEDDGYTISEK